MVKRRKHDDRGDARSPLRRACATPTNPAYYVDASALNAGLLGGNTASGGEPLFDLDGSIGTSSTLPASSVPWGLIENYYALDVPSGITLTIAAGAVVKGGVEGYSTLTGEGTLDAGGTSTSPITFTSVNDNTVGGTTGTGTPTSGDWQGIEANGSGSLDIEHANVAYAETSIDASAGSSSLIKVDSDYFHVNGTAVSISAAVTTNAQVEDDSFVGNTVAIDASSNWSTLTADPVSCFYVPTMTATGNTFDGSSNPIVTPSDYALITGGGLAGDFGVSFVQDYPPDWADNVQSGSTDTISVSYEPCIDVISPEDSYVAIAIPFNLDGSVIVPIGGSIASKEGTHNP